MAQHASGLQRYFHATRTGCQGSISSSPGTRSSGLFNETRCHLRRPAKWPQHPISRDNRVMSTYPTETYLFSLIDGNLAELTAGFAGQPVVDDPLGGHVAGVADFERFVAERRAWLAERHARVEPLRTTRND